MDLEGRGVPAVYVATTEFRQATEAQSVAVGFEPAVIYVQHPVQDRTPDEVKALARDSLDAILAKITKL